MDILLFLAQAATPEITVPPAGATAGEPTILAKLLVGLLLGAAGQTARAIVGLKKTSDEARALNTTVGQRFCASELIVSLLIGGVAGVLGAIALLDQLGDLTDRATLVALVTAGYAGTDFIEGFMRNSSQTPATTTPPAAAPVLDVGLGDNP